MREISSSFSQRKIPRKLWCRTWQTSWESPSPTQLKVIKQTCYKVQQEKHEQQQERHHVNNILKLLETLSDNFNHTLLEKSSPYSFITLNQKDTGQEQKSSLCKMKTHVRMKIHVRVCSLDGFLSDRWSADGFLQNDSCMKRKMSNQRGRNPCHHHSPPSLLLSSSLPSLLQQVQLLLQKLRKLWHHHQKTRHHLLHHQL
jgi:hypothetical protein